MTTCAGHGPQVDQYYLGSRRAGWSWETQRAGVQYTLDTVLTELAIDPDKKFLQVDTSVTITVIL